MPPVRSDRHSWNRTGSVVGPECLAFDIISMMDGLQIQWLHDPDTIAMGDIFVAYVERLIASLR